jgi:hypothetical protein
MNTLRLLLTGLLLAAVACGGDAADPATDDGKGGKADNGGGGEFLAALEGREDALGKWLRETSGVNDEGLVDADYVRIVTEIAEQEGCSVSTVRTFLISDTLITGESPFPRTVTTLCSDDPAKASNMFLSAPEATEDGDIDIKTIEMFAWDAAARQYRFYRVDPVADGQIRVELDPPACAGCHTGSVDQTTATIPMAPVMNELTLPWPHWNSEPDATSHTFSVSDDVKGRENYNQCVTPWLGSAPNLEQIIRAGFDKSNNARLRARRNKGGNINEAMSLLHPVFCTERVNFATEDAGQLIIGAVVDEGIPNAISKLGGGPWAFYNDRKVRIGTADGDEVDMMVVRGAVDVTYENQLMSVRGLPAEHVLAAKLYDWNNPAFSDARCQLWNDASERLAISPPEVDADARTSSLVKDLFLEIMQVKASDGTMVSLVADGKYYMVDRADEATVVEFADAVQGEFVGAAECDLDGFCEGDLTAVGDRVQGFVDKLEADGERRSTLWEARNIRACIAVDRYKSAPDIANLACD